MKAIQYIYTCSLSALDYNNYIDNNQGKLPYIFNTISKIEGHFKHGQNREMKN